MVKQLLRGRGDKMDLEAHIRERLKAASVKDQSDLVFSSTDEFINVCLGKVGPGEFIFDVPLEEIVSFWFNRCVDKTEAIRWIIHDLMAYFQEQLQVPLYVRRLPKLEAELDPKQLRLKL